MTSDPAPASSTRTMFGKECLVPPEPDLVSEVLQDLRLAKAAYGRNEMTAPWGIELPFEPGVRFHFVVEGQCLMRAEGLPATLLKEGDVVLLPRGTAHEILSDADAPTQTLAQLQPALVGSGTYRLTAGGGGPRSLIVCCTIGLEGPTAHALLEMLPPIIHVRRDQIRDPYITTVLGLMSEEIQQQRIGGATMMARLADIVLTHVIRTWVETGETSPTGWLAAVRDPQIGRALAGIHRAPERDWTLDSLAALTGLSRSRFAHRFSELLGVAPARYLVQWRMQLATSWIRNDLMSVTEAASRLGYESEAAFSRAFKRTVGVSPSAVRIGARRGEDV